MKFKVGDLVRPTRETIIDYIENGEFYKLEYYNEFQIIKIDGIKVFYGNKDGEYYTEKELELVPETPEFEYGEEIDVYSYYDKSWVKAIFISKIPGNVGCKHACVTPSTEEKFKTGEAFEVQLWKTARKPCLQITRKEIAEKLGISEDFVLIDDVNQDEI